MERNPTFFRSLAPGLVDEGRDRVRNAPFTLESDRFSGSPSPGMSVTGSKLDTTTNYPALAGMFEAGGHFLDGSELTAAAFGGLIRDHHPVTPWLYQPPHPLRDTNRQNQSANRPAD